MTMMLVNAFLAGDDDDDDDDDRIDVNDFLAADGPDSDDEDQPTCDDHDHGDDDGRDFNSNGGDDGDDGDDDEDDEDDEDDDDDGASSVADDEMGAVPITATQSTQSTDDAAIRPPTVTVNIMDAADAQQTMVQVSPPPEPPRGKRKVKEVDARSAASIQTFKLATCGCALHNGSCYAYLYRFLGLGELEDERAARYIVKAPVAKENLRAEIKPMLEIIRRDATSITATLTMTISGRRVCIAAFCHAKHTPQKTMLPLARDVVRAMAGVPLAPKPKHGKVVSVRLNLKDALIPWIRARLLLRAQPAPNVANRTRGLGVHATFGPRYCDAVDEGATSAGQLQLRKPTLVCSGFCRNGKLGSRRAAACDPATCEMGAFIAETPWLPERHTAGRSLFKQQWELQRLLLEIHYRTRESVTGDCYICSRNDARERSARARGDTAALRAAQADKQHHHNINLGKIKAEVLRNRHFAAEFARDPAAAQVAVATFDDDCGSSHKVR